MRLGLSSAMETSVCTAVILRDVQRSDSYIYTVSRQLNAKVLSWIEFNFEAQRDHFKYAECIGQMPRTLRLELLSKLHNQCLCSHSVFQALIGDKSNQFLDELYGAMTVQCFAEDEIIASNYQPSCRGWDEADRTYLIREGAADLCIRETR